MTAFWTNFEGRRNIRFVGFRRDPDVRIVIYSPDVVTRGKLQMLEVSEWSKDELSVVG